MKHQAILDFSDDGKAVVQIPDVGKMAFINTFGLSKISEVEKDIEEADTAERKQFMQNYISEYRSIFGNDVERSKETTELMEKFEAALVDKFPIFTAKELDCYDYTDEQYDDVWDIVSEDDSPELEYALENSYIREISVNVYKMKHSTAWYLFGNVKADIDATVEHIECMKGLPTVIDNIDKVVEIIRKAVDARQAINKLTDEFNLTRNQAAYAVGFQLSELAGINKDNVQENIAYYEKILTLLKNLDK